MSKVVKSVAPIAGSIIGNTLLPGIGGAALGGALGGGLSGGGLKGALLGGVGGALGGSSMVGNALGGATGLSGAGLNALQQGLGGAVAGSSNGLKGALLGGLTGAGAAGIGSAMNGGLNDIGLGTAAGTPLSGGLSGPTQGTGILGTATKGLSNLTAPLSGGGAGSAFKTGITGLGTLNSMMANADMEDDLLKQQRNSMNALNPYLQGGAASNDRLMSLLGLSGDPSAEGYGTLGTKFNAGDFETDPGYQFRLQQGEDALARQQAARGNYFSGQALKQAQDYGQGLADQAYNDAYDRWRQGQMDIYNMYANQAGTGLNAAGAAGNIYSNIGNIQANKTLGNTNATNSFLASLLGGSGLLSPEEELINRVSA